jgi:hypothetical protein
MPSASKSGGRVHSIARSSEPKLNKQASPHPTFAALLLLLLLLLPL